LIATAKLAQSESESDGVSEAPAEPNEAPSQPEPKGDAPTGQELEAEADDLSDNASPSDSEGEPAVDEPADEPAQLDAPRDLPKELKERFPELDDEAKRFVIERERAFNKRYTEKAKEAADHRNFAESVLGQFTDADRQQLQAAGMSESDAVGYFLQLNRIATQTPDRYLAGFLQNSRDPAGLVRAALQHLQISPEQAFSQQQSQDAGQAQEAPEDDFADDPYFQQLQAKMQGQVEPLQQQLQQERQRREKLERLYYGERQSREQKAVQTLEQAVQEFKSDTDETGSLKYPHYDQLEPAMIEIMNTKWFNSQQFASPRERLEAAYDRALYAEPTLRQEAIEREAEKRAEQRQREQQKQRRLQARTIKGDAGSAGSTKARPTNPYDVAAQSLRQFGFAEDA